MKKITFGAVVWRMSISYTKKGKKYWEDVFFSLPGMIVTDYYEGD